MNLAVSKAESTSVLSWHILLESQADGQVVAWVAEWPDCRVVAESREMAIESLKVMLDEKGKTIEIEPLLIQSVAAAAPEHPMMKFVGVFQDDPDFMAWHDRLWAEKQRSKDNDEILSVEECMQVV
jgi:predicted RNase H-like HicB family nuclease